MVPPASHGISRAPQYSRSPPRATAASPTGLSPAPVAPSSSVRLPPWFVDSVVALPRHLVGRPTPLCHRRQAVPAQRFRLLPGRSPLLGEYSLLVGVLRCFSSPAALHTPYGFKRGSSGITRTGLPHSDTLGSAPTRGSPRRFVAWSRPSSARDAKASTVCPSCGPAPPRPPSPETQSLAQPAQMLGVVSHLSRCSPAAEAAGTGRQPCRLRRSSTGGPHASATHYRAVGALSSKSLNRRVAHSVRGFTGRAG